VHKWQAIDEKLIKKYDAKKSKYQRARLKQKGIANFYFLRWHDQAVIFHTSGEISDAILYDDRFYYIYDRALEIRVSENISVKIAIDNSVTVRLTKESYKGIKAVLWDVCRTRNRKAILDEFNKLNGLPAWKGIVKQKKMLADYVQREVKRFHIDIGKKELILNTRRKIYKVFSRQR
jgi:hypothetical protein